VEVQETFDGSLTYKVEVESLFEEDAFNPRAAINRAAAGPCN
jgi:hypothetical protein